jgi:hypothetical protein
MLVRLAGREERSSCQEAIVNVDEGGKVEG